VEKIRALQGENSHGDAMKEWALLAPSKSSLITRAAFRASAEMS